MRIARREDGALCRNVHVLSLWHSVRPWFWQALSAILLLLFIAIVIRPFTSVPDPDAEDVASAWNQSIARLGIVPLYPPTEDFYVGDLWAVIADGQPTSSEAQAGINATSEKSTLIGKSVRVAYIDLRADIKTAKNKQPIFVYTSELKPTETFRRQDNFEKEQKADDRIALTLAAFPGITITHKTKAAGTFGWAFGGGGGGRDDQRLEEIRIPVAETYGAPAGAAFLRLDQWCADAKTKIFCSDEYVRRIIAYSVSDGILATRAGAYTTRIQLRLINRVFLTREIVHRRSVSADVGAAMQINADRPGKESPAIPPDATPPVPEDRTTRAPPVAPQPSTIPNVAGTVGGRTSLTRADATEITLHETFQRPVVFGFRAITVDLSPSVPEKASP